MNRSLTATLKYALSSEKKMELVAKLIRGKRVADALNILDHTPNKAAKILLKVLKSAIANATNNADKDIESLFVKMVDIGRWPKLKRVKFVGRSRVHGYVKYRTYIRVVLNSK